MKKINIITTILCLGWITLNTACSNEEDFADKPNPINLEQLKITPVAGGCDIAWTPNPDDKNFVFLNVEFVDHDNQLRRYNVSRYGSSLVTPNQPGTESQRTPEVIIQVRDLVNQTYNLNFFAYNNDNHRIGLGSLSVTPEDYTENIPDSIYGVNITTAGKRHVTLEWNELPLKSSSTLDKIYFEFVQDGKVIETKEYEPGIRHDTFQLEKAGNYDVNYGTRSAKGKTWQRSLTTPIEVVEFFTVPLWTAEEKAQWTITGTSVQESEGPYTKLIDGDKSTFWASNWSDTTLPYELVITLDRVINVGGIIMQQRQNCSEGYHRCVKDFEIYFKENENDEWKSEADFTGSFADNSQGDHLERQDFNFSQTFKAKLVKIKFTKAMFTNGDGVDGNGHNIAMAEFGLLEVISEE